MELLLAWPNKHMPQNKPSLLNNKINLLQRDLIVATKFRHLTKVSLLILAGYMAAVLGVFSFYFFLSWQRNGQENKNQDLVGQIHVLKDTEGLLVTLKNRVAQARGLFSAAKPTPAELVETQVKLLPAGAEVSSINAKEDGTVALVVRAQNSAAISAFLTALRGDQPTTVVLNSLILADDGGYIFGIEVSE